MKRYTLIFGILLCASAACAQDPVTGFPPYGSFAEGRFDAINRQSLNVNFAIPVISVPGRGIDMRFALIYDSLIWKQSLGSPNAWTPVTNPDGTPSWGWKKDSLVGAIPYATHTRTCLLDPGPPKVFITDTYYTYVFVDLAGTTHPFVGVTPSNDDCIADVRTGYASDNSGYYIDATNPTAPVVYSPVGMKVTGTGTLTDTNGNFISSTVVSSSETDWTDSAGHAPAALKITKTASQITYQYRDTSGTWQTIQMKLNPYTVQTNFACANIVEYNQSNIYLPYEIDLPNNQKYVIAYEATPGTPTSVTGRVQKVTLPTGGYYEYDYPTTGNNGIKCSDSTVTSLTKLVNDGSTTTTWQFARTQTGSSTWKTTVTAPQLPPYTSPANQSTFTFTNGAQTAQKFYQGSEATGTLLRTINTTWAANGTPSSQTVILEDNQTQTATATNFDTFGNLLSLSEYDWGTGAPGSILRTTTLSYLATSAYTALNIRNRLTQQIIKDGNGTKKSRTDIAYDETSYLNSPCVTSATQHDNGNYGCTFNTRGNPTTVTVYTDPVTPGGGISKHTYYDSLGNAVTADVNCCQQEQWNYSATTNFAYPDSVVRGPSGNQLTTSATYNSYTGLVASATDENNQQTTFTYDLMKRLVDVQRPDGAHLTWNYTDATPPAQSSVTATTPIQGTNKLQQTTVFDGLGQAVKSTTLDASQTTYSILERQYDPLGRPYRAYNPHNGTRQYYTESQFDALGRPVLSILQDNSQVSYAYATNTATVTDPAGKQRKSKVDGLGQLVSVWEPDVNNGNSLTQQTSYAYTVFDTLATVSQGVQTRTYNYDALARLTSATTPETNNQPVRYQYDPVFYTLVTQRTDVRGVITNYNFDNLNRLHQISYNVGSTGVPATPTVTLTYGTSTAQNNNGRLISMTDGVGSEAYTYDILGRVTQVQKTISGTPYPINYGYNLAGELTSVQYPSGRTVQPSYDAIGRLSTIADTMGSTNTTYASSFGYNPAFEVMGFNYGNGVVAAFGYSADRLQLQCLDYSTNNPSKVCPAPQTSLFRLSYGYSQGGGNNGQITSTADSMDGTRSLKYTYDALYRLSVAQAGPDASPTWKLGFTYDRYGNRTQESILAGCGSPPTCPTNSVTIDANTNRITGSPYSHDANGNMTNDGQNTLTYDAENRAVTSASGGTTSTYTYDGGSLRVKKQVGTGTATVYIFSGTKVIAEYVAGAPVGSPTKEYIYTGSVLLATIASSNTTYHHSDHLSVRLTTAAGGSNPQGQGHYPFGEQWYPAPPQSPTTKWQFTSYERDGGQYESGNDYAMMRYYVNRLGRFSSLDPMASSIENPQSLNRFAYVANDPVNAVDPSGLRMDQLCFAAYCGTDDPLGGGGWGGGWGGGGRDEPPWPDPSGPIQAMFDWMLSNGCTPIDWVQGGWTCTGDDGTSDFGHLVAGNSSGGGQSNQGPSFFDKFAACTEANRLDNALRALGQAYDHPDLGNAAANLTNTATGAAVANQALNLTASALVPAVFRGGYHSTSWPHFVGSLLSRATGDLSFGAVGKWIGRRLSNAAVVTIVAEGAYNGAAMARCGVVTALGKP